MNETQWEVLGVFAGGFSGALILVGMAWAFGWWSGREPEEAEEEMTFSQHEQKKNEDAEKEIETMEGARVSRAERKGVTAKGVSVPSADLVKKHRLYREIYRLCVDAGLDAPSAVSLFFGGKPLDEVTAEPAEVLQSLLFTSSTAGDRLQLVIFVGGSVYSQIRVSVPLEPETDVTDPPPTGQPHDGTPRLNSGQSGSRWCNCTRCCDHRLAIRNNEMLPDDYWQR